jgi:hypothetical protein
VNSRTDAQAYERPLVAWKSGLGRHIACVLFPGSTPGGGGLVGCDVSVVPLLCACAAGGASPSGCRSSPDGIFLEP